MIDFLVGKLPLNSDLQRYGAEDIRMFIRRGLSDVATPAEVAFVEYIMWEFITSMDFRVLAIECLVWRSEYGAVAKSDTGSVYKAFGNSRRDCLRNLVGEVMGNLNWWNS